MVLNAAAGLKLTRIRSTSCRDKTHLMERMVLGTSITIMTTVTSTTEVQINAISLK